MKEYSILVQGQEHFILTGHESVKDLRESVDSSKWIFDLDGGRYFRCERIDGMSYAGEEGVLK